MSSAPPLSTIGLFRFDDDDEDALESPECSDANHRPFIIGVAGGTSSGKTTVCDKIIDRLERRVSLVSQDSFYKSLDEEQRANVADYNFDHPSAFDDELLLSTLMALRNGRPVEIPEYDFKTHSRTSDKHLVLASDVIIVEGILILYDPRLRDMMDMKIFVDTDDDLRLARRIRRDIAERGRDLFGVLEQYEKTVKPSYDEYIHPTKKHADIIIPRGGENEVAIDLIVKHIEVRLHHSKKNRDRTQGYF